MKQKDLIKKMLIILGVITIVAIVFFVVVAVIRGSSSKASYDKIRGDMVSAAKKYYDSLEVKLSSGEEMSVTTEELIQKKYLDDYSEKLDEGVSCSGVISIHNNFDNMLYVPKLDCGDAYKDITLVDKIKELEPVVTENDGLYGMYDSLVYRGEYVNNYLEFAGESWTILKINSDGTIRAIMNKNTGDSVLWDDRYNTSAGKNYGLNNYDNSRLKEYMDSLDYGNWILSDAQKAYVKPQSVCVGNRYSDDPNMDYSVECSQTSDNNMFGLLQVNEYIIPSLDSTCKLISEPQCTNYNYMYNRFGSTLMWTTTINSNRNYYAYAINGLPDIYYTNSKGYVYVTIKLDSSVLYLSGDGSIDNPYKIKEN